MKKIAQRIAKMGRFGDSRLVHVTPREEALLLRMSGRNQISKNPLTGLPEYFAGPGAGPGSEAAGPAGPSGPMGGPGDVEADPGAAAATAAAQADAQAAANAAAGFGGTAAAAAEARDALNRARLARTAAMPTPRTAQQIAEMSRLSAINTVENPMAAAMTAGLAGMAMGPLGRAAAIGSLMDPSPSPFGADPFGTQGPLGFDVSPEGLASAPAGTGPEGGSDGLELESAGVSPPPQDSPQAVSYGYAYTNPFTGKVVRYAGERLPWQS